MDDEATAVQPIEQHTPQAEPGDQPLHPNFNHSCKWFMALLAESKLRIKAMSPVGQRALLDLGDLAEVMGVGPEEAMRILEELEGGWDNNSEEDDKAAESGRAEGGKSKVTKDEQDINDKTAQEAGGAQDGKQKVVDGTQEGQSLPTSKS
ncbi:hypothetical protein INS49_013361 [Diaporthe citri]|uniref:uncharacterized protein n=1 Tax=Diaporthe citri TaxID=83186 RepID=UPI001C81897B|nr:uncharacterized protein INS49_013361 [Diaporthe citri]KAG6357484.1 hypothetical protein INS49_013361 [Diaporthe citri]